MKPSICDLNFIYLTNLRFEIPDKFYLSNFYKIFVRNLEKDEIDFFVRGLSIIYSFLLSKYSLIEIMKKYQSMKGTENKPFNRNELGSFTTNDYFLLFEFKYVIDIYMLKNKKEEHILDEKDFNIDNVKKYLYNYFEKFIVIDFDSIDHLLNLINKYNNSDEDSNDKIMAFRKQFMNFYNYINDINIKYEVWSIEGLPISRDLTKLLTFYTIKTSKERFVQKNNKGIIDKFLLYSNENFYQFMFILETFYDMEEVSDKKTIIDYVTLLEMIVTHTPDYNIDDSIRKQFIDKISACLTFTNYIKTKEKLLEIKKELDFIYNYRSKLLHGEYSEMTKQLKKFLNINYYNNKYNKDIDKKYYKLDNLIEMYISIRIKYIFKIIFKLKVKNNILIESLK